MTISDVMIGYLWVVLALKALDYARTFVPKRRKPDPWRSNDFSEVKPWLAALLRKGYRGGHMRFSHETPDRSLRFRKYIREKADYGLELCIPGADDAAAYWPQVQAYCEETGLRHRMEGEDMDGAPGDVLLIDCEQDVDLAYDLAVMIWTKVYHLSTESRYDRDMRGISIFDDLIDSPDHPGLKMSPEDYGRVSYDDMKRILREQMALSPRDLFQVMVFGVLARISLIGLPIATLLSAGDPPDWTLALGDINLGGSTASLVFFLIYVFSFLMLRGIIDEKKKFKERLASNESPCARIYSRMWRFITITLPIAVILIWAGA